jgi:5'-nucleotidase
VDEAFFLGGVSKQEVLSAFGAHIFFDDQAAHAKPASQFVPSAVVPYADGQNPMRK